MSGICRQYIRFLDTPSLVDVTLKIGARLFWRKIVFLQHFSRISYMYELSIFTSDQLQNKVTIIKPNTFGFIPGHCALLGSNDESLGWNIVANVSLFIDCVINKYPDDVQPGFQAPDVILVILNMDEGTLGFKSGVDGTNYGFCLSGLRAFSRKGQKLFPAISVTKQGAEIGIKYLGSSGTAFAYDCINIYQSEFCNVICC